MNVDHTTVIRVPRRSWESIIQGWLGSSDGFARRSLTVRPICKYTHAAAHHSRTISRSQHLQKHNQPFSTQTITRAHAPQDLCPVSRKLVVDDLVVTSGGSRSCV